MAVAGPLEDGGSWWEVVGVDGGADGDPWPR